jgi:hypothetical protein
MCDTAKRASITHTGVCVIQVNPKYPLSVIQAFLKYPKYPKYYMFWRGFPQGFQVFFRVFPGLSRVIQGDPSEGDPGLSIVM